MKIVEILGGEKMYTVKQVAEKLNITIHTVRYYTDQDLIPGVIRDKNNNRLFDEEALGWLMGVVFLKEGGMSIKQIREYVDLCLEGDSTIFERYEIIVQQYEQAQKRLEDAQKTVDYMENKVAYYNDLLKTNKDEMNPGTWNREQIEDKAHQHENASGKLTYERN